MRLLASSENQKHRRVNDKVNKVKFQKREIARYIWSWIS